MITLAQALSQKTKEQLLTELLAALAADGVDVTGFAPTSVSANLPAEVAAARAEEQALRVTVTKAGLGDYWAEVPEAWCDAIARAWWRVTRIAATKARFLWPVTAAAGAGLIDCPARELSADGATSLFDNVASFRISGGETKLIEFEARTAGTDGNVQAGAVTGFQVGKAGLSISSPAGSLIAAGRPKETNTELVRRGRARFPTESVAGNTKAYDAWIPEAAPTVTRWAVDDANPNGPGSTDVYAANAAGPATLSELAALTAYFAPRRAKGTGPLRFLAAPALTLTFGVRLRATVDTGVAVQAASALTALEASLGLGGSENKILYLDTLREPLLAIAGVYQVIFDGVDETTMLASYQVVDFNVTIEVIP